MSENPVEIQGIPVPVIFRRSKRARRIIVTTNADCVKVSVPWGVAFAEARAFVQSITPKIRKHIKQLQAKGIDTEDDIRERNSRALAAGKKLSDRFTYLARKHGFSYSRLTIRNQSTIWGSCSHKNNISLNIALADLPEYLIDYVMLHELVHTLHPNHGRSFWAELDKYSAGNAKLIDKQLRKFRITRWS